MKVEIGPDGMPVDPHHRHLAVRFRCLLSQRGSRRYMDSNNPIMLFGAALDRQQRKEAMAVWNAMEAAGSIRSEGDVYSFVNGRLDPVDADAKRQNYLAAMRGMADRLCDTEAGRRRALTLVLELRGIYGIHIAPFGRGNAVLVPTSVSVSADGPAMAGGIAVLDAPEGLLAVDVPGDAVRQSFEDGTYRATVDETLCTPNRALQKALLECHVSPFTSRPSEIHAAVVRAARGALTTVGGQRAACSAFVGEEIDGKRWLSFTASLRRAGYLTTVFPRVMFKALDPETRRAAMRNPVAKAAHYSWLRGGQRRIQASAVYPVLAPQLQALEEVIDRGGNLNEAMSLATGLPVPVLRRLAGVTWQKLGRDYGMLAEARKGCDLFEMLSELPPERVPATRAEWSLAGRAARNLGVFGWPSPGGLAKAVSKDWKAFARLVDGGLMQAVRDSAVVLQSAADGVWDDDLYRYGETCPEASVPAFRALAEALMEGGGGTGRLRKFSEDWHRGEARRTAAMNAERRKAFGNAPSAWKALWPDAPFSCAAGTLEFLCDEDRLVLEGVELRHCVGSYWRLCLTGLCHIAAVRGVDGGRSTVEIAFEGKKLVVVQHRAKFNGDPTPGCEAVVEAFLKAAKGKARRKDFERFDADVEDAAEKGPGRVEIGAEDAERMLGLYRDCLPSSCSGRTAAEWSDRMRIAASCRIAETVWDPNF